MDLALEHELRAATFAWLEEQVAQHGDVLPGALLRYGLDFRGQRVPLAVQSGIHKPRFAEAALSLRTSLRSPYSDEFEGNETLVYRYRGTDPDSWDNRAARRAYEHRLPVVYLYAVSDEPPKYLVVRPVWIVGDDPAGLAFRLQADGPELLGASRQESGARTLGSISEYEELQRSYATRLVKARLHQESFRERVLRAYREQCAMCRLRQPRLLEAAHIDRDADPLGEPVVSNGLSLCRIHHGAFDLHLLSVEPDSYRIRVRRSLLEEEDGPMLRHGLQGLEGERLELPRRAGDRPDPVRLARHWARFASAS
ncbi:MAG TPA: HNH endonuclease [Planctomycetota bacterium]|nr:HNH endonuclease [Planctomycetota bacterium]